ncbi:MAG: hypothetical protein M1840_000915 [Geoglossum simile]|nr:MAG: hypothetical protein M1840_000915 [Geoglossum simile]
MAMIFGFAPRTSIETQLTPPANDAADASNSSEPRQTFNDLPIAKIKGRRFVSDQLLSRKGCRPWFSWIKDHGLFVREVVTVNEVNQLGDAFWICRRCDQHMLFSPYKAEATSPAGKHLAKDNHIYPQNESNSSKVVSMTASSLRSSKRLRSSPSMIPKSKTRKAQELALCENRRV